MSIEERQFAIRLAGALFVMGGVAGAALLLLPGVEDRHWPWVVAIAAAGAAWGTWCIATASRQRTSPVFWHAPAVAALAASAAITAATGGAASPARFCVLFVLVYVAALYPAAQAVRYLLACVAVAALPLGYDGSAVGEGYVAELVVLGAAYLLVGGLLVRGRALLVDLDERARAQALRDPLTDLPNRRAVVEWLGGRVVAGEPAGLLLVYLDGLKNVNSLQGYPQGDRVVCEAACRLRRCVRSSDIVAHLGGDELAILTPDGRPASMRVLAARVLDSLRGIEDCVDVPLSAGVGWAVHPTDAQTVDGLVAAADLSLRGANPAP